MPINKKYKATFHPYLSYHVYNRTNGNENLFHTDQDRLIFLQMVKSYLFPYFEVHCYCLLNNHFHLLITSKSFCELIDFLKTIPKERLTKTEEHFLKAPIERKILMNRFVFRMQFRRLFLSYTKYFNRVHKRTGNLFNRGFKRIFVHDEIYFKKLVLYIHQNPLKHDLTNNFQSFEWSSYQDYANHRIFINSKDLVLDLFNGINSFKQAHQTIAEIDLYDEVLIDK